MPPKFRTPELAFSRRNIRQVIAPHDERTLSQICCWIWLLKLAMQVLSNKEFLVTACTVHQPNPLMCWILGKKQSLLSHFFSVSHNSLTFYFPTIKNDTNFQNYIWLRKQKKPQVRMYNTPPFSRCCLLTPENTLVPWRTRVSVLVFCFIKLLVLKNNSEQAAKHSNVLSTNTI